MTTSEVIINDLTPVDTVFMETAHSTYQFVVTDPATRTGILSGGLFSDHQIEANFLCSVSTQADCGDDSSRIKVGSRAVFIYTSEASTRYIVISVITKLTHTQHRTGEKNYFYQKIISTNDRFCTSLPH